MEVKGFGALQDVELSFAGDAPIVLLYGPNEAGKSTLMQFIRAVLFGFAPRSQLAERYEPLFGGIHGGELELRGRDGRIYRVQRYDAPGPTGKRPSAGTVTVTTDDGLTGGEELLRQIIGDMSSDVYKAIFAFGLTELEQLRTLQSDEVNSFLFSSGLGISPAVILDAEKRISAELDELFKPRGRNQAINQLVARLAELEQLMRQSRGDVDSYQMMFDEVGRLNERIAELEQELKETEERALWIEICLKSQDPWQQLRAAEEELRELPRFEAFPEDAMRRYDEERLRLEELRVRRSEILRRVEELSEQIAELQPDPLLLSRQHEIAELYERSSAAESLAAEMQEAKQEMIRLQEMIRIQLTRIDAEWTEEQAAQLNTSLAERSEIISYRERFSVLERKLEAAESDIARSEEELARLSKRRRDAAALVEQAGSMSEAHALRGWRELSPEHRRRRLQELKRAIDQLRQERTEANVAERYREEQLRRSKRMRHMALVAAIGAATLTALLLLLGWSEAAVTAAGMTVAAVIATLIMWRSQTRQLQPGAAEAHTAYEQHAAAVHRLLKELSSDEPQAADSIEPASSKHGMSTAQGRVEAAAAAADLSRSRRSRQSAAAYSDSDHQRDAEQLLREADAALEQLELMLERLQASDSERRRLRAQLEELERQLQDAKEQRRNLETELSMTREQLTQLTIEWQTWLAERGLSERLNTDTVSELFTLTEQVKQLLRQRDSLQDRISGYAARIAAYEQQVRDLWLDLSLPQDRIMSSSPSELVKVLTQLAADAEELMERRQSLEEQRAERQVELAQIDERIKLAESRIAELWREAGATDEAEFRLQVTRFERCRELEDIIQRSLVQLEWLVTAGRLERLRETLEQIGGAELAAERDELADRRELLGTELTAAREQRAKLEHELSRLRDGSEQADYLQQREELLSELQQQVADYTVYKMAEGLLKRTRELYERERQPEVLRHASRYLHMITDGRYERILAPFGEQRLILERSDGRQIDTTALSRGTAEQLYLAMRFALIEAYSEDRDALPLVLDDILVNFDEGRTIRCLEVIREVSNRHQVLMFTCHDYMRKLVTEKLPHTQVIRLAD